MEDRLLGQRVFPEIGETLKLLLIDLLDDGLLHGSEHGILTCEILVKVVDVPFGFL